MMCHKVWSKPRWISHGGFQHLSTMLKPALTHCTAAAGRGIPNPAPSQPLLCLLELKLLDTEYHFKLCTMALVCPLTWQPRFKAHMDHGNNFITTQNLFTFLISPVPYLKTQNFFTNWLCSTWTMIWGPVTGTEVLTAPETMSHHSREMPQLLPVEIPTIIF